MAVPCGSWQVRKSTLECLDFHLPSIITAWPSSGSTLDSVWCAFSRSVLLSGRQASEVATTLACWRSAVVAGSILPDGSGLRRHTILYVHVRKAAWLVVKD